MIDRRRNPLILSRLSTELMTPHDAAIGEQLHRVVDGGTAHMVAVALYGRLQRLDVKVLVHLAHLVKYCITLGGFAKTLRLQILRERGTRGCP